MIDANRCYFGGSSKPVSPRELNTILRIDGAHHGCGMASSGLESFHHPLLKHPARMPHSIVSPRIPCVHRLNRMLKQYHGCQRGKDGSVACNDVLGKNNNVVTACSSKTQHFAAS